LAGRHLAQRRTLALLSIYYPTAKHYFFEAAIVGEGVLHSFYKLNEEEFDERLM
jgi:hypothetical protein